METWLLMVKQENNNYTPYSPYGRLMKYILLISVIMLYAYFMAIYYLFYPIWREDRAQFKVKNIGK